MSVCLPVIQLLAASRFVPHGGQERGVRAALHTQALALAWDPLPDPEGTPSPGSSRLRSCHEPSIKLNFNSRCVSRADPHLSLS